MDMDNQHTQWLNKIFSMRFTNDKRDTLNTIDRKYSFEDTARSRLPSVISIRRYVPTRFHHCKPLHIVDRNGRHHHPT